MGLKIISRGWQESHGRILQPQADGSYKASYEFRLEADPGKVYPTSTLAQFDQALWGLGEDLAMPEAEEPK